MASHELPELPKLPTGIEGLDFITDGGLPAGRTTLVAGSAGSAKTVFAVQFLAAGVAAGQPGVMITFEESVAEIRVNARSLGFDIEEWERRGMIRFVDASPSSEAEAEIVGQYDFGALLVRVEAAVDAIGAQRVSFDSIGAVFSRFPDPNPVRSEMFRVVSALRDLGVTSIVTAERTEEYGEIARFGVEEFVADNVVILRNVLDAERRRRTIEVLKLRGTGHRKGEFPFTILPGEGIVIIPLSSVELQQRSSDVRITSGNTELDEMCGGGLFRDSVILVSGATGTGKTLMSTEFIAGGVAQGERCLLMGFEESRDQLFRNARGWGFDFEAMERDGLLRAVCTYPETASVEDHLVAIKAYVDEFQPQRIAIDSFSAIERVASERGFREFVIALTSFIKHKEIAGLVTSTSKTLLGGESVTESHISTLTDSIILLRYVEMFGEVRRGMTVLKMRGSLHEKAIREFSIDNAGMHIGRPFRNTTGILTGNPVHASSADLERFDQMFSDE